MYHPQDTVEIWSGLDKNLVDNLWYKLNYFQVRDIKETNKNIELDLFPLPDKISLTSYNLNNVKQYTHQRLENFLELDSRYKVRIMDAIPDGLILFGLGAAHIRETSVNLHQVYGVPYIPASSLKGVVRNWAVQAFGLGDEDVLLNGEDLVSQVFKEVFGTQENRGSVQFYDLFFEDSYELEKDMITPHFADYYSGKMAPTDDQNPIPINLLGIRAKRLRIYYTVERKSKDATVLANTVGEWIKTSLLELGIGSKTTSGYGRFKEVNDVTQQILTDLLEEKRYKAELKRKEIEERRKKEEIATYLATLSEGERLAYKIKNFGDSQQEVVQSKTEIYERVLALPSDEAKIAADALKEYWKMTGDWQRPSKKQKMKNRGIAGLIENE